MIINMSDKWRVLYAEDDEDWQVLAREALSKEYEVTFASSLAEVDRLLREQKTFDVALIDLGLGGYINFSMQGGRDAAIRLQQQTDAKVGLFSAMPNDEAKRIARELGVPLFDKTNYDGFCQMVNDTLYYEGAQGRQERHY